MTGKNAEMLSKCCDEYNETRVEWKSKCENPDKSKKKCKNI